MTRMDMKIFIVIVSMAACGPYADPVSPTGNPECGSAKLGVLMSSYAVELDGACRPFKDLEECKGDERDAVEKKYEKLFNEWIACKGDE